ncbi:lycopene beta-cyclase [Striga asiatica]|uniref:Lycopene beta-cyclase n=1 Tax=Striga asiatica TaxID=4170 RepID=A0A5A7NY09_STRAF|nr:lycopene beta-cyclase [Striga asiatica]
MPFPSLMASLFGLHPTSPLSFARPSFFLPKPPFPGRPSFRNRSRNDHDIVKRSTKIANSLDLEPKSKPKPLTFDLPRLNPIDPTRFDVIVIGAGPAGLRVSEQVSQHGLKVCCVDPSPLSMWPNNYGGWVDEFESLGFEDCLHKIWPVTSVYIDDQTSRDLDRAYARVDRSALKSKLLSHCTANGVKFHEAKVRRVEHGEFESSSSIIVCDDGTRLAADLIVDAGGFASGFVEHDRRGNPGYQVAHGILAEVDEHPFDLNKMVLMDYRDSHLANDPQLLKNNSKLPTFLYAMPLEPNLIFLEETSLVSRPAMSGTEVRDRLVARLRHWGIRVREVVEDEKCAILMGGPLPRIPQRVVAMGGNSGLVHPSTAYMLTRMMALAPEVAGSIAHGGSPWESLWPAERRREREFYNLGMEMLLRLDLGGTRRFLNAFFELEPLYLEGFFSCGLTMREILGFGLSVFWHGSGLAKVDLVTKGPVALASLVANNLAPGALSF